MISKINTLWVDQLKSRPEWEPYFAFGFIEYDIGSIEGSLEKRVQVRKDLLDTLRPFYKRLSSKSFIESGVSESSVGDRLMINEDIIAGKLKETIRIAEAEIEIFESELKYFFENNELDRKKRRGPKLPTPQFFAFEWLVGLKINEDDEAGLTFVKSFFGSNGELGNWILDMSKNDDLKFALADSSGIQGVFDWSKRKRQILERIVLSRRTGVEVKSMLGFENDFNKLRDEVSKSSEKLKSLSNAAEI